MSPAAPRPCRTRVAVVVLALTACSGDDAGPPDDVPGGSETGEGGGPSLELPAPTDACESAPTLSYGRYRGTLRNYDPEPATAGVCQGGGPDAFARVVAPVRADLHVEARGVGFVPRLSLAPDDCAGAREIACSETGALDLPDLVVGTVVRVGVGADPAVFSDLNLQPVDDGAADPLGYELDISFTRVLAAGEVCLPESRGRCADGTLCLPSAEGSAHVCTKLPGDTCAAPEPVTPVFDAEGRATVTVDVAAPHTDAHRHRCTGAGTREHVLRLVLPPSPPQRALEVRTDRDDTGLAARAPGCLADDEVACAAAAPGGARVVLTGLASLRAAGVEPYLFVELPEEDAPDPPLVLELRLVPEPASWGDL